MPLLTIEHLPHGEAPRQIQLVSSYNPSLSDNVRWQGLDSAAGGLGRDPSGTQGVQLFEHQLEGLDVAELPRLTSWL